MKKITYCGLLAAILILIASCHHDNVSAGGTGSGGTWSLNSFTFKANDTKVDAGAAGYSFYASTGPAYSGSDSTLSIQFYGMTSPTIPPGTYHVSHQVPPDSGTVYIGMNTGTGGINPNATAYGTQGGSGSAETVVVSTINGKTNITGSGIKMTNLGTTNYGDTNNILILNVTQQ